MKSPVCTFDVVIEDDCALMLHGLSPQQRRHYLAKLALLRNPAHPSLNVHRVKAKNNYFIAYLTVNDRCVFRREGNLIRVVEVGSHGIVDSHRP